MRKPTVYQHRRLCRGFTLVELLTVIGIIVILLGILLPVVASIRKKGFETSTSQEMSRIGTACQAYYSDFHAYPGPMPEGNLDSPTNPPTAIAPVIAGMSHVTSSQNLVLGLVGGLTLTNGALPIKYDVAQIQNNAGPQNLNVVNPRQINAYLTLTPDELPTNPAGPTSWLTVVNGAGNYTVPEILDHIPIDPPPYHLPILYVRARPGAAGIVLTSVATNPPVQQYTFAQLSMYKSLINSQPFTDTSITTADAGMNDYPIPSPNPNNYADSATVYFANPNLGGQPRGKDSFILISAGTDHIYGTKDDIIYSQ